MSSTHKCKNCDKTFYRPGNAIGRPQLHCSAECRDQHGNRLARARVHTWPQCAVDDCVNSVRSPGSMMCPKHYHRVYRNGTTVVLHPQRDERGICTVEECGNRDSGPHGLCNKHHSRLRRNGSPTKLLGPAPPKRGVDNPSWLGSQAGYTAVHDRIRRRLGSATDQSCADCGGTARQWSYNHDDPNERIENDMRYSATDSPERHYSPRCVPCHKSFDLARLADRT